MFASRDMDEHIMEGLENKSIRYISDRYKKTPLAIAE